MQKQMRAWQRMLSGRRLDLLDPSPFDIEISDIVHGLSFVARWNGQTVGDFAYSVAEHSLLVEHIFSVLNPGTGPKARLAALLHDAPEYVIGDMISPVKAAMGPGYSVLDEKIMMAVHVRFGLPRILPKALKAQIKVADLISARLEAVAVAGFNKEEADELFGPLPVTLLNDLGFDIRLRSPQSVRQDFLKRFDDLWAQQEDADRQG